MVKSSTRSPRRGEDRHRKLAAALQHGASARLARIQATGSGGLRTRYDRAVGSATPTVGKPTAARAGVEAVNALTFDPDHSVGADQCWTSQPWQHNLN